VKHLHDQREEVTEEALERLFELATYLTDAMDRGLAERRLTRARAELLWRLGMLGPVTQRRLSTELQCTPRNVTDLVDALERDGFVTREPHPTDRRATLVTLTGRGAAEAATMHVQYRRTAGELFADLDAAQVRAFSATLARMLGRLRREDTVRAANEESRTGSTLTKGPRNQTFRR
jgi:DNA-binding MarR family transcriptional regulator